MKISTLIIDFSGMVTIDTEVAGDLFTIHNVLSMLGIAVLVTGIRPELGLKVVSSGIDLSLIKVFSTVKQAIDQI